MISNLDEEIHLYDGNFRIYKLSKVNFTWTQVAKLGKKLEKQGKIVDYFGCFQILQSWLARSKKNSIEKLSLFYFIAPLAFSDGSWWLTGGLDQRNKNPTAKTIFYDKMTETGTFNNYVFS